ncbi:MAG: phosphonoacetaldehyde reductase [Rhodospirillales bacterium]|nr:phosphonoacetaldehyde reductase [Rhodospirillales bacterium]MBO6787811.1 phosphonoacetaldehyde reductase [Rhodospirillales bacterium]
MVLNPPVRVSTQVHHFDDFAEGAAELLQGRPYSLISSNGWITRGAVERLKKACGSPVRLVSDIPPNPTLKDVVSAPTSPAGDDVVVALGGGSVIDAAKGVVALQALDGDVDALNRHLCDGEDLSFPAVPQDIIAVPTTSGTGSEITKWGTIWGDGGVKYSVKHDDLAPVDAIIDPSLLVSMPADLTISTALDAMSHAMESVWNRRHNAFCDSIAEQAIRRVRELLPLVLAAPDDKVLRGEMHAASMMAAIVMGTTQTALAHSISYPFTAMFGIPHGYACSFSLGELIRYNGGERPDRMIPIARAFDCQVEDLADSVENFLTRFGVGETMQKYVTIEQVEALGDDLITRARAANNVREVDGARARELASAALRSLAACASYDANTRRA